MLFAAVLALNIDKGYILRNTEDVCLMVPSHWQGAFSTRGMGKSQTLAVFFSLLATSQRDGEGEEAPKSPSATVKVEPIDCPRDSGCYIVSDCSDNSKEDAETHVPAAPSPSLAEV